MTASAACCVSTAEKPLEDQYAVVELAFVFDLALVGEEVVAQVHPVREGVPQYLHRPGSGDLGRDLGTRGVFDEVGGPGGSADLAPHLDVFDGVGNTVVVDVGEFPQGFVEEVLGAFGEPVPPVQSVDMLGTVRVHRSERPRSTGLVGVSVITPSTGMNARSLSRYSLAPARSRVRL